jgi:hypothetical protein
MAFFMAISAITLARHPLERCYDLRERYQISQKEYQIPMPG